jgi:hypothetical protein
LVTGWRRRSIRRAGLFPTLGGELDDCIEAWFRTIFKNNGPKGNA